MFWLTSSYSIPVKLNASVTWINTLTHKWRDNPTIWKLPRILGSRHKAYFLVPYIHYNTAYVTTTITNTSSSRSSNSSSNSSNSSSSSNNCIGHILHTNCLLQHVTEEEIEGRTELTGRRGRRRKQILDDPTGKVRILGTERGSTKSQSVENSLWKRMWTCRKISKWMNE